MSQPDGENLNQAEEFLRAGRRQEARAVLIEHLRGEPRSAQAWWLMSFAVDDPDQKIECVQRVLQLHPDSAKARQRLLKLQTLGQQGQIDAAMPRPADPAPALDAQKSEPAAGQPAVSPPRTPRRSVSFPWAGILIGLLVIVLLAFAYALYTWVRQGAAQTQAQPLQASAQMALAQTSLTPTRLPVTRTPSPTRTPRPSATASETPTEAPTPSFLLIQPGYPAPDFTLEDSQTGQTVSLSQFLGRPVLMVFMVSWCHSCHDEAPNLEMLYTKYKDTGLVILGIDYVEDRGTVLDFMAKHNLTFPVLLDSNGGVLRLYKARYFPSQFYIRPDGIIATVDDQVESMGDLEVRLKMLLQGSFTPMPTSTP